MSSTYPTDAVCKNCGAPFVKVRSRHYYCSLRCRRVYNQQKADGTKYSSVSPAEWGRYKNDPHREEKKNDCFVVCRECAQRHSVLQRHITAKHHIPVERYIQKWGNPPLVALSLRDLFRRTRAGKPHKYARGKKYLGENVRGNERTEGDRDRHSRREVPPTDDATLAQCRLGGKSIMEIAAEADLTHAAVVRRLKDLGFPSGRAYRFIHGEPVSKKHFDDLRNDFDVEAKEIIGAVGENPAYEGNKRLVRPTGGWRTGSVGAPRDLYGCLLNHLKRRDPEEILLARFANIVLDARKRWTEAFCFDYRGGRRRIRCFRQSEARELPRLIHILRKPLTDLRVCLREQDSSIEPDDILNWICEQSRMEVARSAPQGFRRLMFLWPALGCLVDQKGFAWLVSQQRINMVIYELLARDYDATAHAISQCASGKVAVSPAEVLGRIIRARLAEGRGLKKRAGRSRKAESEKSYLQVAHEVDRAIPRFQTLMPMRHKARKDLLALGCSEDEIESIHMPGSHTPTTAARWFVSISKDIPFDTVAQYHKRSRKRIS